MNRSVPRRIGWRIAVAIAVTVAAIAALLVAPLATSTATADNPLPSLSMSGQIYVTGTPAVGQTLTIHTGTWTPTPSSFSYQWYRDYIPISGANASTYSLTDDDQAQNLWFVVTGSLAGYQSYSARGWESNPITGPNSLSTISVESAPDITGISQVGQQLSVTPGTYEPSDVAVGYAWISADGISFGPDLTTFTPTENDIGDGVTLRIILSKPGYAPRVIPQINAADVLPLAMQTYQLRLNGAPVEGNTLSVFSYWNATPDSLTYQWTRDGSTIDGATNPTYLLASDDVGHVVAAVLTATHADVATGTVTVATPSAVTQPFVSPPQPTISGTAQLDSPLTVNVGDWGEPGTTFSYTWYVNGSPYNVVSSSNTANFVDSDLVGKTLTVVVTASAPGFGPTASIASAPTAPVIGAATSIEDLTIPAAQVNQTISPSFALNPYPPYIVPSRLATSYVWKVNGVAVPGATSSSYTPQLSDLGGSLTVTMTITDPSVVAQSATSNAVIVHKGYLTWGVPTISGPVRVGSTLQAVTTNWGPAPISFHYIWGIPWRLPNVGFKDELSFSSHYTVPASLKGRQIELWVSGTKPGYLNVPYIYQATDPITVAPGLLSDVSAPTISGTPAVGYRLTATHGSWSPSSGETYDYQWFSATSPSATPTPIAHATASTYVVTRSEWADLISVRVTVHKSAYSTATGFSAQTRAIVLPPSLREPAEPPIIPGHPYL